jgi:three-Cys-motif partner protein
MVAHEFGGPWTEVKLAAVEYYLKCYTKALRYVPFDLSYIDAFAGTGDRQEDRLTGGMFDDGGPVRVEPVTMDGSALLALAVEPPFQHFTFIEAIAKRCEALEAIRDARPGIDIKVLRGDANKVLAKIVGERPWTEGAGSQSRGVVFLDPYALQVEWKTLQALGRTELLDVWYLFPLRDVVRQLAHRKSGIGPKEKMLDDVLGPEWRELYSLPPENRTGMIDMFEQDLVPEEMRNVDTAGIESWFKKRLETVFKGYVSDPLPILTAKGRHTFSLFLAVGNRSKSARELAEKFVRYANRQAAK